MHRNFLRLFTLSALLAVSILGGISIFEIVVNSSYQLVIIFLTIILASNISVKLATAWIERNK